MATKNFSQMTTKRLTALLETASEEDKVKINEVLEKRAAALQPKTDVAENDEVETENAELSDEEKAAIKAAEANGGINPMYAGKTDNDGGKAKKMSDKERAELAEKMSDKERTELAEKLKAEAVGHRCQVVPFNTIEFVNGTVCGVIEDKRSNKVLLAIKTDDGRRIVKVHDSKLLKISDEVVEIQKASRGRKAKDPNATSIDKADWLPEEIEAEVAKFIPLVGKKVSYPKFSMIKRDDENEEKTIESGRIVSLVPDKRGKRILLRVLIDQTEEEIAAKASKKYAHKVSTCEDLKIEDEFDEEGSAINKTYCERRSAAAERNALTPAQKVELAEKSLEIAKRALEKAQEAFEKRKAALEKAQEELKKYLTAEENAVTAEEETAATEENSADSAE